MDALDEEFREVRVVCTVQGCENRGDVIQVSVNAMDPAVICGGCGEWIIVPDEATTM